VTTGKRIELKYYKFSPDNPLLYRYQECEERNLAISSTRELSASLIRIRSKTESQDI